jgi:hypothetical protein
VAKPTKAHDLRLEYADAEVVLESDCSCVIDTSGLHELATASANLKATLIARLEDGTIGVPSWACRNSRNCTKRRRLSWRNTLSNGSNSARTYTFAPLGSPKSCVWDFRAAPMSAFLDPDHPALGVLTLRADHLSDLSIAEGL